MASLFLINYVRSFFYGNLAWVLTQSVEDGREEGHNEVFTLLNQGLSIEEIKQRLTQTVTS